MRIRALLGTSLLFFIAMTASAWGLTQLPGTTGCLAVGGEAGCAPGRAISEAFGPLVISPDGHSAYLVADSSPEGIESNAIDVFDRDPTTGALTQKPGAEGCVSSTAKSGCAHDPRLVNVRTAVISPDGRDVYVTAEGGVLGYSRDTATGALSALSLPAFRIAEPLALAVSPEGTDLYVTSGKRATVSILRRDPLSGGLSQAAGTAGCVVAAPGAVSCTAKKVPEGAGSKIVVAPDGRNLYVVTYGETPLGAATDSLEIFARSASGALRRIAGRSGCLHPSHGKACPGGRGLRSIEGVALSPDGRSLYLASGFSAKAGAISIFRRAGNKLTQPNSKAACLSANGGECRVDPALSDPAEVTVSPDGTSVYLTTLYGIAVLDRDEAGNLTAPAGAAACLSDFRHSCAQARGIEATTGLAVSPDAKNLYVTSLEPGGVAVFSR